MRLLKIQILATANNSFFLALTADQREKLLKQREQYEKGAEGLEDQLLKLKVKQRVLFPMVIVIHMSTWLLGVW